MPSIMVLIAVKGICYFFKTLVAKCYTSVESPRSPFKIPLRPKQEKGVDALKMSKKLRIVGGQDVVDVATLFNFKRL